MKTCTAEETLPAPGVPGHWRAGKPEETFGAVASIRVQVTELVDAFEYMIVMELGDGDELRVLHIHEVLLIEGFRGEFAVSESVQCAYFV